MLTKTKLLLSIKDLPEKFSIEDLLDRVLFLQKVETGLEQSAKGKKVSTKQAKEKLKKWLK
ncbi:MAG: hypothetical protein HY064_00795 [Bacteroidetes bacterium]|nr:hypothetical protein [Bacteroidota bacterium]